VSVSKKTVEKAGQRCALELHSELILAKKKITPKESETETVNRLYP